MIALAALTFVSCMDDGTNESKATISYYAACGNINYQHEADTVYQALIMESLDSLGYTGKKSLFEENATIGFNSIMAAYTQCDIQAIATYEKKQNNLTLESLKENIYQQHTDSLTQKGYTSANELPLDTFSLQLHLVSTRSMQPIKTYEQTLYPAEI